MHGVDLKAAAEKLAKHLGLHTYYCSSGWLWRFRQRPSITQRRIFGEALSGDFERAEPFRKK
jgi:hypothetical protein